MSPQEDQITAWFAAQSFLDPIRFPVGIGDDMAQVCIDGGSVLITTDMLLDGTHFDLNIHTLEQVGSKAMKVNLSDCAAMATRPLCAVGASALPRGFEAEQLRQIHRGVQRVAEAFDCPLIGGDITVWKDDAQRLAINITMLSTPVEGVEPVRRSGAQVGDIICVTGALGGSRAGKHLTFTPRVHEAITLAKEVPIHAMMDISDGLSTDLNRICTQSGVGAILEAAQIPISDAARQQPDPLAGALHDGEDFELLFTITPQDYEKLVTVPIFKIGAVTHLCGMRIVMPDGSTCELTPGGYDHL
ncbi:MAG: thiamine-monophosphate kinase [Sedimentisphaerales bacterium]|nr:thiamine-monophosphate kinase [Sedimentisphaerales bacterium]